MRIEIAHTTLYTYSAPVRLDTQIVRLKPRNDSRQTLLSFELSVDPASAKTTDRLDPEGWWTTEIELATPVTRFEITTRGLVETVPLVPLFPDSAPRLPWRDVGSVPDGARPLAVPREADDEIARFAADVATGADWEPVPFLHGLALRIQRTHHYQVRRDGPPWAPRATLAAKQGSCRDFAVLYVAACRAVGIPARFVSGYRIRESDGRGRELHAWAEAWIPGAGWRGFDPTIGRHVEERHVAVAAGSAEEAAPVTGSFWGPTGVSSTLEAVVDASGRA